MSRSLLGTGADLLTVGWQTLRLMWSEPEPEPDAERRGDTMIEGNRWIIAVVALAASLPWARSPAGSCGRR